MSVSAVRECMLGRGGHPARASAKRPLLYFYTVNDSLPKINRGFSAGGELGPLEPRHVAPELLARQARQVDKMASDPLFAGLRFLHVNDIQSAMHHADIRQLEGAVVEGFSR